MICLRDFKRGLPEERRRTFCGVAAADRATACTNLEWWRKWFGLCPTCWNKWCLAAEAMGAIVNEGPEGIS